MNEKNIEMLKARLGSLGFVEDTEAMLRCAICFLPQQFQLSFLLASGKDSCHFTVHFLKGEKDLYDCLYYQATLCKAVAVPEEMKEMDEKMDAIDWKKLAACREGDIIDVAVGKDALQAALLLEELSSFTQGNLLQYKYWAGTALESIIEGAGLLKNRFEISQRFYFVEDQPPISADEAMRFLQSRWAEKKVQANQKLLAKKSSGSQTSAPKLLMKRPRKLLKQKTERS